MFCASFSGSPRHRNCHDILTVRFNSIIKTNTFLFSQRSEVFCNEDDKAKW